MQEKLAFHLEKNRKQNIQVMTKKDILKNIHMPMDKHIENILKKMIFCR